MAAQLIQETDIIDVSALTILVYGPPGAWKTSLAQTAADPITLDLDRGAHRAFNRKAVMRFDTWTDINDAGEEIAKRKTVIVDTIGRALDLLAADIIKNNAKHGTAAGGMSLQGYGVLKARFAQWMNQLRLAGKDVAFIAHEKEEKDGDDRYMRPDIVGGSYTEVMKFTDLVGYVGLGRDGSRTLDFNPSDRHLGKNAAGWNAIKIPDLAESKTFLADLITDAKKRIGHTAEASSAVAKAVAEWTAKLDADPPLDALNAMLPGLTGLTKPIKAQVWAMICGRTEAAGLVFNPADKRFEPKELVA